MPTWRARCKVQHGADSKAGCVEDNRLSKLIVWCVQNKDRVLSYYNYGLVDRDWSTVHRMSRARRAWTMKCLNTANEAYENECRQAKKIQNVITKFFSKHGVADTGGEVGTEGKGSAVADLKRRDDGDGRAECATQVFMEEGCVLMLGKARDRDEERKESDVPRLAPEVLESESEESE